MTKEQYVSRLREQLKYYEGDHEDIISNYDTIIDELIDEGCDMQDVIARLGRPGVLADDIAEEFGFAYTQQTIQSTTMPLWARNLLIIVALIIIIPTVLSLVFGVAGSLIGVVIGIILFLFGGIFTTTSLWGSTLSLGYKTLITATGVLGIISSLIMTYFVIYWFVRLVKLIIASLKTAPQGGNHYEK